jgi:catechol 2,3-dioxygenase-like lactoylglutathione lyase family enzyme
MPGVHHTAISTNDIESSVRFWRDGLGLTVLMDSRFPGDWETLFGVTADHLRAVFLGDPKTPNAAILELVAFEGSPVAEADPPPPGAVGFLLVSLYADLDEALPRLATLGCEPTVVEAAPGVRLAVVRDPNGVLVELMDRSSERNLARLTKRDG